MESKIRENTNVRVLESYLSLQKLLESSPQPSYLPVTLRVSNTIFMLDPETRLILDGNAYKLQTFANYIPVEGDIVLRNSNIVRTLDLEKQDKKTAKVTIRKNSEQGGVMVTYGQKFQELYEDKEGLKKFVLENKEWKHYSERLAASHATQFLHDRYAEKSDQKIPSGVITTEEILGNDVGVCFDFSVVLSMLFNSAKADSLVFSAAKVVVGRIEYVKIGSDNLKITGIEGHAWVRTESGLVLDPNQNITSMPSNNLPSTVILPVPGMANETISLEEFTTGHGERLIAYSASIPSKKLLDVLFTGDLGSKHEETRAVYFEKTENDSFCALVRTD